MLQNVLKPIRDSIGKNMKEKIPKYIFYLFDEFFLPNLLSHNSIQS